MHGMYGTLDESEVQRTIKRAELSAFLLHLTKAIGPTMVHVDNKGIIFSRNKNNDAESSNFERTASRAMALQRNTFQETKRRQCGSNK